MITHNRSLPDIRMETEARLLVSCGAALMLLSPASSTKQCKQSDIASLQYGSFRCLSISGLTLASVAHILRHTIRFSPDIIHIHDSPVYIYASLAAMIARKPVIFDNHEIWPNLVDTTAAPVPLRKAAKLFYWLVEFFAARVSTRLVAVVEEAALEIAGRYRIDAHKIVVVHNCVSVEDLKKIRPSSDPRLQSKFVVTYVGGFEKLRGLEAIESTLAELADLDDLVVVLVGDHVRNVAFHNPHVILTGWLPLSSAESYIAAADVCLILHRKTRFTDHTLPYKITQYFLFGKPVVSTPLDPIVRLFPDAVEFIKDGDSSDFARALRRLYSNYALRIQLGNNGRQRVLNELNWERAGQRLVELYQALFEARAAR